MSPPVSTNSDSAAMQAHVFKRYEAGMSNGESEGGVIGAQLRAKIT